MKSITFLIAQEYSKRGGFMFNFFLNGNNANAGNSNTVVDFKTLQNARRDLVGELDAII